MEKKFVWRIKTTLLGYEKMVIKSNSDDAAHVLAVVSDCLNDITKQQTTASFQIVGLELIGEIDQLETK